MTVGMLWFDNSNVSLTSKIEKAVIYYVKKYGRQPELCLVNPKMMEKVDLPNITVRPYRPILPGHIWIGNDDDEPKGKHR